MANLNHKITQKGEVYWRALCFTINLPFEMKMQISRKKTEKWKSVCAYFQKHEFVFVQPPNWNCVILIFVALQNSNHASEIHNVVFLQGLVEPWRVTCPRPCLCELRNSSHLGMKLRTLDCSNRNLKTIPGGIPAGVECLLLQVSVFDPLHNAGNSLNLSQAFCSNNGVYFLLCVDEGLERKEQAKTQQ